MITCSRTAALLLFFSILAPLKGAESAVDFQAGDIMGSVLTRQTGQTVELRLKSGEKIGGKVEKVGAHLVHLTQLTGAEFYEAAVSIEDVSAVVVRTKK